MKLKGINHFEQHVEKIVAGIAVLAAVAFAAWHFLAPELHKVGSKEVGPGEIDGELRKKAQALSAKMANGAIEIADSEGSALPLAVPEFNKALAADVAPSKSLRATGPNFNSRLVKAGAAAADTWYSVPAVPVVQMKGVLETADAITKDAAAAAKESCPTLAARPDFEKVEGPKDVVWTTPFAKLDLKALRAEFQKADAAASPARAAVPGVWYQEAPQVVDVVFERRERAADGSWGAPKVVPVYADRPAELMLRERLASPSGELRDEVSGLLGTEANQRDILQPNFFDTVNGAFVSPALLADAPASATSTANPGTGDPGSARRRLQLRTELQRKQASADKLRAELDKLGGVWDEEAERKREDERKRDEKNRKQSEKDQGSGGGGGGAGGGLGGAMSGKNNAEEANTERDEKKRAAERKAKSVMYRRLQSEIAAIEKQLGVEPTQVAAETAKAPTLASLDEILVWGHDMDVQAGRTYQYRCVVRVYNPFFGKGNQLVRDQDATGIANPFTLDSIASGWSDDIAVSSEVRFFVTRSSAGDGTLGAGSAQIEIYKLQGGVWRRDTVSVQPGDRIGGVDRESADGIDFTTSYVLVDVIEDLDPLRAAASGAGRRLGIAVVAPLGGGGHEVRVPALEQADQDRLRLNELSEAAKEAAAGAPAGAPAAPGT
jgi:hypothetical protein